MPDALPKIESDDAAVTATPVQSISQLGTVSARRSSSSDGEVEEPAPEAAEVQAEKGAGKGKSLSAPY